MSLLTGEHRHEDDSAMDDGSWRPNEALSSHLGVAPTLLTTVLLSSAFVSTVRACAVEFSLSARGAVGLSGLVNIMPERAACRTILINTVNKSTDARSMA